MTDVVGMTGARSKTLVGRAMNNPITETAYGGI